MSDTTERSAKKTTKTPKATKSVKVYKKRADITFSNFDWIDIKAIHISIHKFLNPDDEKEFGYKAILTLLLDLENGKGLMLDTDIYDECPHCCARDGLMLACQLGEALVLNDIILYDENYDQVDEFSADELFEELYEDDEYHEEQDEPELAVKLDTKNYH